MAENIIPENEENKNLQVDSTAEDQSSKGADKKLVIKFKGQEKVFDLTKEDDLKKIKNLAEMGYGADQIRQKANDVNDLAQQAMRWNTIIAQARTDETARQKLFSFLEQNLGQKLSIAQQEEVQEMLNDPNEERIQKLGQQIEQIREELKKKEEQTEAQKLQSKLLSMQENKAEYPFFDYDEVVNAAIEANTTDFDMVYKKLYFDRILKAKLEEERNKHEQINKKRKMAFTETGGSVDSTPFKLSDNRKRSLESIASEALQELHQQGKSLIRS